MPAIRKKNVKVKKRVKKREKQTFSIMAWHVKNY